LLVVLLRILVPLPACLLVLLVGGSATARWLLGDGWCC
jgi:hypothetical protein